MTASRRTAMSLLAAFVNPLQGQPSALLGVREVAASRHVLLLTSDGSVVAMGENRSGQLGRPKAINRFFPPQRVELPGRAIQIAAGPETSYALLEDGAVWAWGRGYEGQLGMALKDGIERHIPMAIPGLPRVASISVDENVVIAVLPNGEVRGWGSLDPMLTGGNRVFPGVITPLPIPGLRDIVRTAGGSEFGFALSRQGRVFAWGANRFGQLGLGRVSSSELPTEIPSLRDVVSLAAGTVGAAVCADGRVFTWGRNTQAGLGDGEHSDVGDPGQPIPQPVKAITDALEVRAGTYGRHLIVRRRNKTLIGWGNSDWGQLGAGISGQFQPLPTSIKLPNVEAYWLGGNFSFARTADQSLWFWGEAFGALGLLGSKGNQRLPARIPPERLIPTA